MAEQNKQEGKPTGDFGSDNKFIRLFLKKKIGALPIVMMQRE